MIRYKRENVNKIKIIYKKTLLVCMLSFILLSIIHAQQQTDTLIVFFDINKSVINDSDAKLLDKLIVDKNIISISIYGYTDFLGSMAYNQQLSEKRSKNVHDYLIHRGINGKNIVLSKGEGIHPNSVKENRQSLLGKGIQAHRIVKVVYTTKLQNINTQEKLPEENTATSNRLPEENLVINNTIVLENVIFHDGTHEFLIESYPTLRELFNTMQKHHTLKIEIQGHICCGNDGVVGYNLSVSRAKAVYNFLFEHSIDSTRMTYKGFGNTRKRFPLEQNEYERSMNRRVEILIMEK